jgi:hypothetical protein
MRHAISAKSSGLAQPVNRAKATRTHRRPFTLACGLCPAPSCDDGDTSGGWSVRTGTLICAISRRLAHFSEGEWLLESIQ